MIERVMAAFEAWDHAKALSELAETTADIRQAETDVARARMDVMDALDDWYEWKRMNGPQKPGK